VFGLKRAALWERSMLRCAWLARAPTLGEWARSRLCLFFYLLIKVDFQYGADAWRVLVNEGDQQHCFVWFFSL